MKLLGKIVFGWIIFCAAAAVGALIVRKRVPEFGGESDDRFSIVAAMGGRVFRSTSDELSYASALACMGGIELDLSEATITSDATLKLRAIMGGIDVTVPPAWRVEVASTTFMGSVGNATNPDLPGARPLLIVNALAVAGGVSIRESMPDNSEVA
ncbi:MAG: LiaF-related protein [Actinomycetota bacterium]|jgi:hypothetical protein|nr:LiaF-related protein [Actinomycetota bacterium]